MIAHTVILLLYLRDWNQAQTKIKITTGLRNKSYLFATENAHILATIEIFSSIRINAIL